MKNRSQRISTFLPARVRTDSGWADATIRNISPHGAMIELADPPDRGSYVELRRATSVIIGRIIWSDGRRCGVMTRDMIDIPNMLGQPQLAGAIVGERRILPRAEAASSLSDFTIAGRAMEFSAMLAAVALGALLLFHTVEDTLSAPAAAVIQAMHSI